jgi:hypothetical protein
MPVYLHLATLIVSKTAVMEKYRGGMKQFRKDYSIGYDNHHQEDYELFAIAAMNVDDFDVDALLAEGLSYDKHLNRSDDFVIKPRYASYLWKVDWLVDNDLFAWHKDAREDLVLKAITIGNETMDVIAERFVKGEKPFSTIV